MALQRERHRFTVDDYYRMAEVGILTVDDRVELIDGEIVEMAPIGEAHAENTDQLTELLIRQVGRAARVRVANPLRLSDLSEPQPDFAIVQRRSYRGGHPRPEDTYAVIEVADTTLASDLRDKARLYAVASIPEYLVIDVHHQAVIRHSEPRDGVYQQVDRLGRDAVVTLLALPDVTVRFAEVFG